MSSRQGILQEASFNDWHVIVSQILMDNMCETFDNLKKTGFRKDISELSLGFIQTNK
jgi:hypothetical protein